MKIAQSTVVLQSQHASASLHTQQTTTRAWVGNQRPDFEGQRRNAAQSAGREVGGAAVSVSISRAALAQMRASAQVVQSSGDTHQTDAISQANEAVQNDPRMRMLMDMVEALTGRKIKIFDGSDIQLTPASANLPAQSPATVGTVTAPAPAQASAGWGLEIDSRTTIAESETTRVSAQGIVNTTDGQQINFTLQLEMSRSFVQESTLSVREGDAVVRQDPLVINFNGSGAQLTDTQFAFDLNADGQKENIAFVSGGSGFLALDKNNDGKINNGNELFGPRSGDGFTDLAQYDSDGNQWIDENDAVYSQLKVWQRDAGGQDKLTSLAQNGVGALYLGRTASPFSVNNANNQTLGQVRSTGVFLYESGQAGSLQQVDL